MFLSKIVLKPLMIGPQVTKSGNTVKTLEAIPNSVKYKANSLSLEHMLQESERWHPSLRRAIQYLPRLAIGHKRAWSVLHQLASYPPRNSQDTGQEALQQLPPTASPVLIQLLIKGLVPLALDLLQLAQLPLVLQDLQVLLGERARRRGCRGSLQ